MGLWGEPICVSTLSSHCNGPCRWISIQQGVLVTSWRWYSAPQPYKSIKEPQSETLKKNTTLNHKSSAVGLRQLQVAHHPSHQDIMLCPGDNFLWKLCLFKVITISSQDLYTIGLEVLRNICRCWDQPAQTGLVLSSAACRLPVGNGPSCSHSRDMPTKICQAAVWHRQNTDQALS